MTELRTNCDPEANGRKSQLRDVRFTIHIPLESGETLTVHMGRKGRDTLLGMLIADCQNSGEEGLDVAEAARKGFGS